MACGGDSESEDEIGGSGEDQEQGRKVEFDHDGIDGCAIEVREGVSA